MTSLVRLLAFLPTPSVTVLALAAAGCGGPARPATPPANTGPGGGAAGGRIEIDVGQFGPLTPDAVITLDRVQALFPDLTVAPFSVEMEDGEHQAVRVTRDGQQLFDIWIEGTTLVNVEAFSPEIHARNGVAVGQRYADAVAGLGELDCYGMAEEDGGNAICWSLASPTVGVILPLSDDGDNQFYGEAILPEQRDRALGGARIERLVWAPAMARD